MSAVTDTVDTEHIAAVREFNRRYTRLIGVLQEHLVESEHSLTEARILFELNNFGPLEVVTLRQGLDLDPGYLSRILTRFEQSGLAQRRRCEHDGRRQEVSLTERGREVFAELDRRSDASVATLLGNHSPTERSRLINAMRTIERILDGRAAASFTLRDPRPGDYGWVVQRNGALYAAECGWNLAYETLVARIVADYLDSHEPHTERAWIAESDGEPVGSIFCMREDDTTARLRLLLVEPSARGLGVGSALVEECLRFATAAGYRRMVLWTTDAQTSARHIYERAGFELVDTEPHHDFGREVTGQTWRRAL